MTAGGGVTPCVALTDHRDGSYSGVIDGRQVGTAKFASYRFFRRSAGNAAVLQEIVIGLWGDGSACEGGHANAQFQSSGGNCFKDIHHIRG